MSLTEKTTNTDKPVRVGVVVDEDYKLLTKKRYFFAWKSFKFRTDTRVFKLQTYDNDDILGVMALIDFPLEKRIEINLLASSVENVGDTKIYEGIAGNLIAYACRVAVRQYGSDACVSLKPKTKLKQHYIRKYGMLDAGLQLFLEGKVLNDIIFKYLL